MPPERAESELALVRVHVGTMHADIGVNTNTDESDEEVKKKAFAKVKHLMPSGLYAIRATVLSRQVL